MYIAGDNHKMRNTTFLALKLVLPIHSRVSANKEATESITSKVLRSPS